MSITGRELLLDVAVPIQDSLAVFAGERSF